MDSYDADLDSYMYVNILQCTLYILKALHENVLIYSMWHMTDLNKHFRQARQAVMNGANPKVIPRNHVIERGIAAAEKGDYTLVRRYFFYYEVRTDIKDKGVSI